MGWGGIKTPGPTRKGYAGFHEKWWPVRPVPNLQISRGNAMCLYLRIILSLLSLGHYSLD